MIAVKAKYDGKQVIIPENAEHFHPGPVLVIFGEEEKEADGWLKAQEAKFSEAWDNEADAAYDNV
jgi:hypothetical protein